MAHEIQGEITAATLAEKTGKGVDGIRMKYSRFFAEGHPLFVTKFDRHSPLSPEQVEILFPPKRGAQKSILPKAGKAAQGVEKTAPALLEKVRYWPLWVALVITSGASVPNMVEVTTAMKGSSLVAWAMTGVFTLIPGLLIAARLRGFLWGLVVIGVMGYTAFCNASAIFGGLTALDKGYILQPTVFLEAVTNMLNTDYLNTARTLSTLMALLIGGIEFVAFQNLAK